MTPFKMRRYTLIAPLLTNAHEDAHYPENVRDGLEFYGLNWTEHSTVGVWNGHREHGVLFEIYRHFDGDERDFADLLGRIGRDAMPDQEAIQVTAETTSTLLWEA